MLTKNLTVIHLTSRKLKKILQMLLIYNKEGFTLGNEYIIQLVPNPLLILPNLMEENFRLFN